MTPIAMTLPGLALLLAIEGGSGSALAPTPEERLEWRAWLEVPGGELPFGLELLREGAGWRAFVLNAPERIEVPRVEWDGAELVLEMPHYDSRIRAERQADGTLAGLWTKRRGPESTAEVPFRASPGRNARFPGGSAEPAATRRVSGRWNVAFSSDELPAVGLFEELEGTSEVRGTFLTATGDYRYLAGNLSGDELRLSCFDGAHAFLFRATLDEEGALAGDFYSGNWWHETWTAQRDDAAQLGDPFTQTSWLERASFADLVFPDLEGRPRSLAEEEFVGQAYLIQLFGSWCPNCHDETRYLVELHERYRDRGLSILGLAFELTGEFERDAEQVRIFAERYGIEYPLFVVGTANKADATRAFPAIDRLRSYPTTIFLSADGRVRSVHSGFAGPATGAAHAELRAEFERTIEALLTEEPASDAETWSFLAERLWEPYPPIAATRSTYRFHDEAGTRRLSHTLSPQGAQVGAGYDPKFELRGDALWIGSELWRIDRAAGVLLDPRDFGVRLYPDGRPTPLLFTLERAGDVITAGIAHPDPLVRREALFASGCSPDPARIPSATALLADEHVEVRIAATWALGQTLHESAKGPLIEALSPQLEDPNAALRRETVRAIGRLAADDDSVLERLDALATDPDPLVREAALAVARRAR